MSFFGLLCKQEPDLVRFQPKLGTKELLRKHFRPQAEPKLSHLSSQALLDRKRTCHWTFKGCPVWRSRIVVGWGFQPGDPFEGAGMNNLPRKSSRLMDRNTILKKRPRANTRHNTDYSLPPSPIKDIKAPAETSSTSTKTAWNEVVHSSSSSPPSLSLSLFPSPSVLFP